MHEADVKCRLDKWLWAARFYKTRALASAAIAGGKVHVNKIRAKPSRVVKINDEIILTRNEFVYEIAVRALNTKRRPAKEACLLYEESEQSIEKRKEVSAEIKLASAGMHYAKKPNKKERRNIVRFKRKTDA